MIAKNRVLLGLAALLVVTAAGCSHNPTEPAFADTDPVVFDDDYGAFVGFHPYLWSDYEAFTVDRTQAYSGSACLRVEVPGDDVPPEDGTYAGGALVCERVRDLSGYNALTFWAKSSVNSTLNEVGLGNDNTGGSLYMAWRNLVPLTTSWSQVIIPIPDSSRLQLERGLFWMAEEHETGEGFTIWFDDIRFANVSGIGNPRPYMASKTDDVLSGASVSPDTTYVRYDIGRESVRVVHQHGYFNYFSSDEAVAIGSEGTIQAVGGGTATITAKLDTIDAAGELTVNVTPAADSPAPPPTLPAGDVLCLFSDVYEDVPVNTWHAYWTGSTGQVEDMVLFGDNVKVYSDLNFAGIEFVGENLIDLEAAEMTHFHMDVWAPSGGLFKVKLVDFGPNEFFDDGSIDDTSAELMFNGGTVPPFWSEQWCALEIPLSAFEAEGLTTEPENLANIVISSSDVNTVIVDNVYFHR